ncbi:MAG: fatty acid desaturase, partial [Bacteroidetes bacterium]|nr:fatty acid desaturase [Bacteroidota bacterium]
MIRYCIPLFISVTYVLLGQFYYFYLILPLLLLANLLNAYWGEFEIHDLKKELHKFYGTKAVRLIKRFSALCFILMIIWSIYIIDARNFSMPFFFLFALCTGCLTGCFVVTLAHDMLHSKYSFDKFLSSGLLIAASIPHLTGDHIFGHHRNIGLLKDTTTARVNQNFYTYFFKLSFTQIRRSFFIRHENIPQFMRKKILFYSLLRIGLC